MARVAAAAGTRGIAATPHVSARYPTDVFALERCRCALQAAIKDAGIPIEVKRGGELALDWAWQLTDDQMRQIALGSGHHVLLECPPSAPLGTLAGGVSHLQQRG